MMERIAEIWTISERTVKELGLELFDIELPRGPGSALRIFISQPGSDKNSGVRVEDCAKVSKKLTGLENFEELLPDGCLIEVSSPGINRVLRLPRHFEGALGERVKLTLASRNYYKDSVLLGNLRSFDGMQLEVEDDLTKQNVVIPLKEVTKARVDFKF